MNLPGNERGSAMFNIMLGLLVSVGIGAVVTIASSSYYGEGGFDMSNPFGGPVQARVYQGKAVADMQAMSKAMLGYFLNQGRYPESVQELIDSEYGEGFEANDPWGNPWVYRADARHFVLLSYGSDSARGPEPPKDWDGTETEPDLIVKDGAWLQVPQRDIKLKAVKDTVDKQRARVESTKRALEKAGAQ